MHLEYKSILYSNMCIIIMEIEILIVEAFSMDKPSEFEQAQERHKLEEAQREVKSAHLKLQIESQELLSAQQRVQQEVQQLKQAQELVKKEQEDVLRAQEKLQQAQESAMTYQNLE